MVIFDAMKKLNTLIVIPARYASTRFPGKPLALINDKPMIQWVVENAQETGFPVIVATDDQRIIEAVEAFGGKAVYTSPDHQSGTDRCYEAALLYVQQTGQLFDVVVNVQGDEPFIQASQITDLASLFQTPDTDIATLARAIDPNSPFSELQNPNKVKVIFNAHGKAIYFSRSVIPFIRGIDEDQWLKTHPFYHHVGMYAYRMDVLKQIVALPQTPLEISESLEQLRWIENDYIIKVSITDHASIGIDTPADLQTINASLKK